MEAFGPDFIQDKYFGDEPEYNEELRERLASAPVFERALRLQQEFVNTRLGSGDATVAWNSTQAVIQSLDDEAEKQGVLHETVALRGEGIRIPRLDVDLTANIAMMSLLPVEKQQELSFKNYLENDEYRGKFAGFTLNFLDGETAGVFIPSLAYRVSMHILRMPHADIPLFATGDVGPTQLHFRKDERLDGIVEPLSTLFEVCAERSDSINRINMTLAEADKYDASIIRHVGYHAEKILREVDDAYKPRAENALIDLITNYLDGESSYEVRSKRFDVLHKETNELTTHESADADLHIKNKYLAILFQDREIVIPNTEDVESRRTLQLAFPAKDDVAFVSLIDVDLFEKQ